MTPDDIKLGQWCTLCCHVDLEEITADNIEDIRESVRQSIEDNDLIHYRFWPTRRAALEKILTEWPKDSDERKEIQEMLSVID